MIKGLDKFARATSGPGWAKEMGGFFDRLLERDPSIAGPLADLEDAVERGDDQDVSAGFAGLIGHMNSNAPRPYPRLTQGERRKAEVYIGQEIQDGRVHPRHAIAIGLRRAAPHKYRAFGTLGRTIRQ